MVRDILKRIRNRLNGTKPMPRAMPKAPVAKTAGPLQCPCGGTPIVPKDEVVCSVCDTAIEGDVSRWNRMIERLDTLNECCFVPENQEELDQTSGPLVRCTVCKRRFYKFGE